MKAFLEQLRSLPTANLLMYLIGAFAVISSLVVLKGIKPSYLQMGELRDQQSQLERASGRFEESVLQAQIDTLKEQQQDVRVSMLKNIPDRDLEESLPTLLEKLHQTAKQHELRTQQLRPGEIEINAEIATVPVSIMVQGQYHALYAWILDFTRNNEGISVSSVLANKLSSSGGMRSMSMELVIYGR